MPVFFQQQINEDTRLGIWKIEEPEPYFSSQVPQHRAVTHPHKRLQHLAGRFLLRYLFPDFPIELIRIADTRKPYLEGEAFHFSISHAGDYAAALVSRTSRVGVDIEEPGEKVVRVMRKFLSEEEIGALGNGPSLKLRQTSGQGARGERQEASGERQEASGQTPAGLYEQVALLWSAKEAVFKWYGRGQVDFRRDIRLDWGETGLYGDFSQTGDSLSVRYIFFDSLVLTWVMTPDRSTGPRLT